MAILKVTATLCDAPGCDPYGFGSFYDEDTGVRYCYGHGYMFTQQKPYRPAMRTLASLMYWAGLELDGWGGDGRHEHLGIEVSDSNLPPGLEWVRR